MPIAWTVTSSRKLQVTAKCYEKDACDWRLFCLRDMWGGLDASLAQACVLRAALALRGHVGVFIAGDACLAWAVGVCIAWWRLLCVGVCIAGGARLRVLRGTAVLFVHLPI